MPKLQGRLWLLGEQTVSPMAALWHLTHMDVRNVIMMMGASLTMQI
jgi:hypothetical protein